MSWYVSRCHGILPDGVVVVYVDLIGAGFQGLKHRKAILVGRSAFQQRSRGIAEDTLACWIGSGGLAVATATTRVPRPPELAPS